MNVVVNETLVCQDLREQQHEAQQGGLQCLLRGAILNLIFYTKSTYSGAIGIHTVTPQTLQITQAEGASAHREFLWIHATTYPVRLAASAAFSILIDIALVQNGRMTVQYWNNKMALPGSIALIR